ncbi:MAG: hypothetical protein AMXMBFR58_23170 [Phycisphaerae bacterium]
MRRKGVREDPWAAGCLDLAGVGLVEVMGILQPGERPDIYPTDRRLIELPAGATVKDRDIY